MGHPIVSNTEKDEHSCCNLTFSEYWKVDLFKNDDVSNLGPENYSAPFTSRVNELENLILITDQRSLWKDKKSLNPIKNDMKNKFSF